MKELITIGFGGFAGSICRYLLSGVVMRSFVNSAFPYGTLAVNALGCFVVGFLAGLIEEAHVFGFSARLFLITGFLGGFTTLSAFGLETVFLLKTGQTQAALLYILSSVIAGIAFVWLGMVLVKGY